MIDNIKICSLSIETLDWKVILRLLLSNSRKREKQQMCKNKTCSWSCHANRFRRYSNSTKFRRNFENKEQELCPDTPLSNMNTMPKACEMPQKVTEQEIVIISSDSENILKLNRKGIKSCGNSETLKEVANIILMEWKILYTKTTKSGSANVLLLISKQKQMLLNLSEKTWRPRSLFFWKE